MNTIKEIKTALVSVFNKGGLEPIIRLLHNKGVKFISTGGTQTYIESLGIPVVSVESITDYPSILGGRVKTLHPKIFGGILGRQENSSDVAEMQQFNIGAIDLVIVDLYPFEETVSSGASHDDIIEKIDIGGISLIRAAAKNYNEVLIVSSRKQYAKVEEILRDQNCSTNLEHRKQFSAAAFVETSSYDQKISQYLGGKGTNDFDFLNSSTKNPLRYGENPHQSAEFLGELDQLFDKLSGKELSYNNLMDVDAAVQLMNDLPEDKPAFVVIKHTNPCGVAVRKTVKEAWDAALAGDPVSAFGGIIICNSNIDLSAAEEINKLFFEILIAPSFSNEAFELLSSKKNRVLLKQKEFSLPQKNIRTALNGILVQDRDAHVEKEKELQLVTDKSPTAAEVRDLLFANKIVKHAKSNTIVLVKNEQLIGLGVGQTSRVDALKQAVLKAKSFNFDLKGAVMASDAFFPFPDCVEIAHQEGVTAVIQPGGSIKDKDSITYCDTNGMAMVFTGIRHFKH